MNSEDTIYGPAVLDMFTVANEFCIFIEKSERYAKEDVLTYLAKVAPLLYIKGILLPTVTVEYPEANERYVTEEQWQDLFNALRNSFGRDDVFINMNPATREDNNALASSLAENLTDIYQDMKDFVLLFGKESHAARENAVYELSQLFKTHWGHRLVDMHRYVHYLLHKTFIVAEDSY
ncbi:MAG: DUF5063 domain-containing protein [Bacteroidales bacterium]|nr:DUF5063 domain-containing protein [Bacteroidales bacterium]MDZ4204063.1 DUF5063 domain-containing protein [Bacteroidales bacterium]